MEALLYVDVPGYAALLLRRNFQDLALPMALMDRAKVWLAPTKARWNERMHQWIFPSGATVSFGYLEHEADKFRYQSAEFQMIGFDELTQFTETQFTFLFSRLRRTKRMEEVPLRMRTASNPGGAGHDWVKMRYIDDRIYHLDDRAFIPAKVQDNPHLDQKAYIQNLMELDPATRDQMLEGIWVATPKKEKFNRSWLRYLDQAPYCKKIIRFWDMAGTEANKDNPDPDWTAGVKMGITEHDEYVILDYRRIKSTPAEVDDFIANAADHDGISCKVYITQDPGSAGKYVVEHYKRRVLAGYVCEGIPTTGNKANNFAPFSSKAQNGMVSLVSRPGVGDYLTELESFPSKGWHDDYVDSTANAFLILTGKRSPSIRIV